MSHRERTWILEGRRNGGRNHNNISMCTATTTESQVLIPPTESLKTEIHVNIEMNSRTLTAYMVLTTSVVPKTSAPAVFVIAT